MKKITRLARQPALAPLYEPAVAVSSALRWVFNYPLQLFREGWQGARQKSQSPFLPAMLNLIAGDTTGWPMGGVGLLTGVSALGGGMVCGAFSGVALSGAYGLAVGIPSGIALGAAAVVVSPLAVAAVLAGATVIVAGVIKGIPAVFKGISRALHKTPVQAAVQAPDGTAFTGWVKSQLDNCTTDEQVTALEKLRADFPAAFNVIAEKIRVEKASEQGALASDIAKTAKIRFK